MPITAIYGPYCEELIGTYIAHETDTPVFPVPIIQDTDDDIVIPENAVFGAYDLECQPGDVVCCTEPTVMNFVNVPVTEIVYGAVLQAAHGDNPTVFVYYFDPVDNSFSILGDYTRIAFDGYPISKITIDHGGLMTGKIKLV